MTIGEEKGLYALQAIPPRMHEMTEQLKRIADALEKMSSDYIKIDWAKITERPVAGFDLSLRKPSVSVLGWDPDSNKVVKIPIEEIK